VIVKLSRQNLIRSSVNFGARVGGEKWGADRIGLTSWAFCPVYLRASIVTSKPTQLAVFAVMTGKGFGGFSLGKMKELTEAFKKAQQVQEGAKQLQEELEQMEIEGQSSGGLVKVYLSGNQEPLRVEIDPKAAEESAEVLSDLVTAAMKDAYRKSTDTMRGRMEELTSGLNIPGFG
jgi:nucleoid-associated protein EbfC